MDLQQQPQQQSQHPLWEAVRAGWLEGAQKALQRLGSADRAAELGRRSGSEGQTLLHVACAATPRAGPEEGAQLVTLLLKSGADANATDKLLWTPLHIAARYGSLSVVNALLDHQGIQCNARNVEGTTPLHYLARRTESELAAVVDKFAKQGADFNVQNSNLETPLHFACSQNSTRMAQLLVRHGAHVNAKNKKGETPLHYAARSGSTDVAALLLTHGARQDAGVHGTPLQVADPMQPELVNLLNAATTRNLTLPAATPPSDARPRTTVLGSSRMPARQRRLRHLHGVSFRRMSSLARCWLSLQLADEEMPVWYQEGPAHSANPEWEIDGARIAKKDAAIEKCEVVSFCLWGCNYGVAQTPKLMIKRRVNLGELHYIGHELSEAHVVFPPRTLVVELSDGFYCTEAATSQLSMAAALPSLMPPKPLSTESYSLAEFVALTQAWQQWRNKKTETAGLERAVAAALLREGFLERSTKDLAAKKKVQRLQALKVRRDALRAQLVAEKERSEGLQETVRGRCDAVLEGRTELGASVSELEEPMRAAMAELIGQRDGLLQLTQDMNREMLRQLRAIYPITCRAVAAIVSMEIHPSQQQQQMQQQQQQQQNDKQPPKSPRRILLWSICGLHLPNSDFTGCEQDEVALALGHVAHIIQLCSRWLATPLRYPMLCLSSRSVIRDDISPQQGGSAKFPLYPRGVDRTRFEYAVFLLNKNLELLLQAYKLDANTKLQNTLPNLWKLMNVYEQNVALPMEREKAK